METIHTVHKTSDTFWFYISQNFFSIHTISIRKKTMFQHTWWRLFMFTMREWLQSSPKMVWTLKVHPFKMCKMKLIGGVHYVLFTESEIMITHLCLPTAPSLSIWKSIAPKLQCHIFHFTFDFFWGSEMCAHSASNTIDIIWTSM